MNDMDGKEKEIYAVIKEVDFMNHKVILEKR
ncbi:MAG: CooT family nickel-binding protein [Candidatus Omnitrophica bacterium]|nr:CooT family nickel-binding protein [Candidatus Omnitrophota bacterium]